MQVIVPALFALVGYLLAKFGFNLTRDYFEILAAAGMIIGYAGGTWVYSDLKVPVWAKLTLGLSLLAVLLASTIAHSYLQGTGGAGIRKEIGLALTLTAAFVTFSALLSLVGITAGLKGLGDKE